MANRIKQTQPSCYELSQAQWEWLEDLLPGKAGDPGRTAADNRTFLNGVLWVLRSGARWSDLPLRYGTYKRFTRWLPGAYGNRYSRRSFGIETTSI